MSYWNLYGSSNNIIKDLTEKNLKLKKYLDETLDVNTKINKLLEDRNQSIKILKEKSKSLEHDTLELEKKNYETIIKYEKKISDMDNILQKLSTKGKKKKKFF